MKKDEQDKRRKSELKNFEKIKTMIKK